MPTIQFTPRAERDLSALDRNVQQRLRRHIDGLGEDPFPAGAKKLHAEEPYYRIRVGDYRIVYRFAVEESTVIVVKIGHRREVYR